MIQGGIQAFYIIPLIIDNESFGTITFSDSKFQSSNIKGLTKTNRVEIENLVRLISPSIYQFLQKSIIEKSYHETQLARNELSLQKAQMERLQAMSQEIQRKTSFEEMLRSLEEIIWESYKLGDFILIILNPGSNQMQLHALSRKLNSLSLMDRLKSISLSEEKSLHRLIFQKKRSLYLSKLKDLSNGEEEDLNRSILDMKSLFSIPFIVNDETFAILSFSDIKPEYSRDPSKNGVKNLSFKQRTEIEQLVSLIANPLYQSLQKAQIEKAYSELQETQAQLVEAERLASLGQLVGGIAHEINNPIAVIHSQAELLKSSTNTSLRQIPKFLETLNPSEKELFYEMVESSLKSTKFLTTKEERAKKKEIQKELSAVLEENDETLSYIIEQILLLNLKPPYNSYIEELGVVRFRDFLSNAMVFKNQSNSLSSIELAVEKASRVVFALRSYLNTEINSSIKKVNLAEEVEKALHVYDNYVMGKINILKDIPKDLNYTCASENLSQVWKNLFFNAIQAMYATDKKLEIRIEKKEKLNEQWKTYKTSSIVEDSPFQKQPPEGWILVSITDSGVGIPAELQEKVFTPFFTTKSLGEGIGLGLYVTKKIVHDHGGTLFFQSVEGRTEFVVVLPMKID